MPKGQTSRLENEAGKTGNLVLPSADVLAAIVEEAFSEIIVFDPGTLELVLVNGCARRNLGYDPAELGSLSIINFKRSAREASVWDTIELLRGGRKKRVSTRAVHRRKDGSFY